MNHNNYESPLSGRYASPEMQRIFSPDEKFTTWRRLWVALAEAERELGLPITDEQIEELRAHIDDIDYELAAKYEREVRHDVMAHVKAYGDVCPTAKGIIHLGATSCYVGDNTDIIIMRRAMLRIRKLLISCIAALADLAEAHKATPALAWTHFQAAQPTTAGKRVAIWIQDLMMDLEALDFQISSLKMLGCRGTTGTAASFLELFDGDHEKVKRLEAIITEKMGFSACYDVSGQTYSRKVDYNVVSVLCGIAQSASKFAHDIRLLSHLKEVDEPFEPGQIGSSAMAYKRNPMRSERICSLSRYLIAQAANPAYTAATQWLERTLDDSANKRLSIPEAFLTADGILTLYLNIARGLTFYPAMMKRHLEEELPFMVTENILMLCVRRGGDRQVLHEAIRRHSVAVAKNMKETGADNDLFKRILADTTFNITEEDIRLLSDPILLTGRAKEQTEEYLNGVVRPMLAANAAFLDADSTINV
ncbi:MAG TPA: adenylosuccinate lyase [Bacillota bacterium]|nr:adenylosuccinate lyase [Clostridiales bacterium]HOQ13896.1 adenylosuccinate lyase [Bacillota bacterium]